MLQETQTGDDGYLLYRRQKPGDDGHVAPGRAPESGMLKDVDNSWVVPYSPLLCTHKCEVLQLSQKHQVWQIRKKGVPLPDFPGYVTDNALGREYIVYPNNREAFHVRLLLHQVRGPISFEDFKTVIVRDEDGDIFEIKPCSTYTEVRQVLGLLEDDSHRYQEMEESAVSVTSTTP
ncbi:ATP-dependent DNA helicase [Trichonephila clavipes]|nr:ATP-dependent DNA helicase [Trichonephila clavipes]